MLGISFEKFSKKIAYYDIQSLMPDLFSSAHKVNYNNKAGSQITYYFPKLVENQH